MLNNIKSGDELKIVVSNTISNACANTSYFDNQDIKIVGTYHKNMVKHEKTDKTIPSLGENIILEKQNGR